jgi:hypothetical protein
MAVCIEMKLGVLGAEGRGIILRQQQGSAAGEA